MPRLAHATLAAVALGACTQPPTAPARVTTDQQAGVTYHMTDLGDVRAFASDLVIKLNDRGQIAGSGQPGFFWDGTAFQDLGTLGGIVTRVAALNSRGQVVGASATADGTMHAFLWEQGQMRDLGTLGGSFSAAAALNTRGQIVGRSQTADGATHAFLWADGQMHDLGTLPGGNSSAAAAINERGQIVGRSNVPKYAPWGAQWTHAALWDADSVVDLGAVYYVDSTSPAGAIEFAGATDINDEGTIVGTSSVPWASFRIADRAFMWRGGVMQNLGPLPGLHGSSGVRINNAGQIAGMSYFEDTSNPIAGVIWTRSGMEVLGSLDSTSSSGYYTVVSDMNNASDIVGNSDLPSQFPTRLTHAYVWNNGAMQDLGSLGGNSYAVAVNNSGDVAGWSETSPNSSERHLVLWQKSTPLAAANVTP